MHSQKNKAMPAQEGRLYCSGWDLLMSQLEGGRPLGERMMLRGFFLSQTCWSWHVYSNLGFFFSTITVTVTIFFEWNDRVCFTTAHVLSRKKGWSDGCICANGTFSSAIKADYMSQEPASTYRGGGNGQNIILDGLCHCRGSGYFLVIKQ